MEKQAKKHWRRIEVLSIILVLSFVPVLFLTRVVPEGQEIVGEPTLITFGVAPVLSAWILLELLQLMVAMRKPTTRELGTTTLAQLYFLAWVAFIASGAFVFYVFFGNIEWVNYFYYQLSPLMRLWLTAFAAVAWLKLVPVIFYKRSRPSH